MTKNKNGFSTLVALIIVVVIIGGIAYYFNQAQISEIPQENSEDKADNQAELGNKTVTLKIHFQDTENIAALNDCGATYIVTRIIPATQAVGNAALKILFSENLTPLQNDYIGLSINQGVATVNFKNSALTYLNGSACTQSSYKTAIEKTLLEFPTVKQVNYAIDGRVFTEWDA